MIRLPELDDATFSDLTGTARALIPTLAPGWTDHNPTDPGIMLVELLAWLAEMVSYRIDQVPERSYRTFLRLLEGSDAPGKTSELPVLDEAIRATLRALRERQRAVTSQDFEHLALERWPGLPSAQQLGLLGSVRRARCFAEHTPETLRTSWERPTPPAGQGHVTLVVVPDSLLAGQADLASFHASRGYALELDGNQAHVACGLEQSEALTGALTLSAWIFPRQSSRPRGIVSKSPRGEFEFVLEADGALALRQGNGRAGRSEPAAIPVGRWSHVAVTRGADGKSATFFRNGLVVGRAELEKLPVATTAAVCIGKLVSEGGTFDGFLRDVCVWRVARGRIELQADLRRAPLASPDLVACWPLDASTERADGSLGPTPDLRRPEAVAIPRDGARWWGVERPLLARPELTEALFEFLDEWRLLATHVHVVGYRPRGVRVSGDLYLRSDGVAAAVRAAAHVQLGRLLDPFQGAGGKGWPFGRAVFESDVIAALDGLPGVDFVSGVKLESDADPGEHRPPTPAGGGIAIQPDELPWLQLSQFACFQRVGTGWQKKP